MPRRLFLPEEARQGPQPWRCGPCFPSPGRPFWPGALLLRLAFLVDGHITRVVDDVHHHAAVRRTSCGSLVARNRVSQTITLRAQLTGRDALTHEIRPYRLGALVG